MKNSIKYIAASTVLASMSLVSCNDLDTQPWSNFVTVEQKTEAVSLKPDLGSAGVVGIFSTMNLCGKLYGEDVHCDFGWPSVMMMMDCIGPDMVAPKTGYNWFSSAGTYSFGTNANYLNNMAWYNAYKVIFAANNVLSPYDLENIDDEGKLYAAQALGARAYMYFSLAQLFQYTYVGHETLPCVPIITEKNSDEVALNGGAPRASVEDVYKQILSDLDLTIQFLSECGTTPKAISSTGSNRFIWLGTAYGLRARVNLVMNNWQAAASDAENAIATSPATPFSIQEASVPAFTDSDNHNCMWAVYIQETDRVVTSGIINWASHMGSLNYGYATVGAWKTISKALFNTIPDTDCRKGWFLNAALKSANLSEDQASYVSKQRAPAYTQVKFAPYKNVVSTTTNASDIFLMRIEEMYLIKAEATAMNGGDGKTILETFVKTYRDPSYTCTATTKEEVQEAVWQQRRIELWGEGMSYYDLLRLNKGLDRRGAGFDSSWVFNIAAPLKPLLVPSGEMEANIQIGANNDSWDAPIAVDDF